MSDIHPLAKALGLRWDPSMEIVEDWTPPTTKRARRAISAPKPKTKQAWWAVPYGLRDEL